MSTTTNATRSAGRERAPYLATTDLLTALFALVSLKLRERRSSDEDPRIHLATSCNVLHDLQSQKRFARALQYLDFKRYGDSWTSEALQDFFFQSGTWGDHKVPNPALSTIWIPESRALDERDSLKSRFGDKSVKTVEALVEAFLQAHERLSSRTGC